MLLLALAAEQHTKSPSLLELLTDFHVCAATATCAAARANVKLQKCGIVVRGMASMEAKFSLSVGESNHISNFFFGRHSTVTLLYSSISLHVFFFLFIFCFIRHRCYYTTCIFLKRIHHSSRCRTVGVEEHL